MQARPPTATESGVPRSRAATPASISPSCGPPAKKNIPTETMRPRISSGVSRLRMAPRTTMLTVSEAPFTASMSSESQKAVESPKTTVLRP